MSLMRWDPFNEIMSLRQAMDRLLEESVVRPGRLVAGGEGGGVDLDVIEQSDAVLVKASLPGVRPEDVDITVQNNVLTIRGETREERESGEGRYHRRERRFGSFVRQVLLPVEVDPNACDANFENGVLTITLPKSEQARPRRIAIRGAGQPAIEGQRAIEQGATATGQASQTGTAQATQSEQEGQQPARRRRTSRTT